MLTYSKPSSKVIVRLFVRSSNTVISCVVYKRLVHGGAGAAPPAAPPPRLHALTERTLYTYINNNTDTVKYNSVQHFNYQHSVN